ncbi:hypothetical protein [Dactylosporangium sp. NPDC048998]|uniref:hypothetical protein n=1 Tax=Dactylosporangium sp. NPDC048998 TaxID=3363976 RepID=UPI003723A3E6
MLDSQLGLGHLQFRSAYDRCMPAAAVTRSSLRKVEPVVDPQTMELLPDRAWTGEQWQRIQLGYQSRGMDEKWNVFVEGHVAHFLRSWTGHTIYEATFSDTPAGHRITAAVVETNPAKHRRISPERDRIMLELVIAAIVLGEPATDLRAELIKLAPHRGDVPPAAILHSALGLRTDD